MVDPYHFVGLIFVDVCTHIHYVLYIRGFFVGLLFAVRWSSAKAAKIGPLKNFPLYGNIHLTDISFSLGVFHGHYRTDTRGMNLNRVYLDPSPELHPSIFAACSFMLHFHKKDSTKNELCQQSSYDGSITSLNTNSDKSTGGSETKLLSISERGVHVHVCAHLVMHVAAMTLWARAGRWVAVSLP